MTRPNGYLKFWDTLKEVLDSDGELCLPNVKEITDPQEALRALGRTSSKLSNTVESPYHFRIQNFDPPIEFYPGNFKTHEIAWYAKIFLNGKGMGGQFDGSGVIFAMINGNPKIYSFAMCEHDWDESGANHSRGWHPNVCKKCGFDASIDSGD